VDLRFVASRVDQRPLEALMQLVDGVSGILFSEALVAEGEVVFAKACELGLEGIVSKRAGSLYRSGAEPQLAEGQESGFHQDVTMPRDGSLSLSDIQGPAPP
jgi:hypothetical protein